jgi:hypothetical protein
MNQMIERVRDAILPAANEAADTEDQFCSPDMAEAAARAAIEAMRRPTPEMYAYANKHEAKYKEDAKNGIETGGYCGLIYEGMIDIARGGDGSWRD